MQLLLHSGRRALLRLCCAGLRSWPLQPRGPLHTFAASLLALPLSGTADVDGDIPLLSDVLADSSEQLPLASRMP